MTAVPQDQWREMRVAGFMSRLGQLQALRGPDGWRYGLLADDSHLNAVGVVHGGVITSLIDHTVALCAWEAAGRRPVVTVQCARVSLPQPAAAISSRPAPCCIIRAGA